MVGDAASLFPEKHLQLHTRMYIRPPVRNAYYRVNKTINQLM